MALTTRTLLTLLALAPVLFSSCASMGANAAAFESNASFRLMLYG